jgi:hypothetical protein
MTSKETFDSSKMELRRLPMVASALNTAMIMLILIFFLILLFIMLFVSYFIHMCEMTFLATLLIQGEYSIQNRTLLVTASTMFLCEDHEPSNKLVHIISCTLDAKYPLCLYKNFLQKNDVQGVTKQSRALMTISNGNSAITK